MKKIALYFIVALIVSLSLTGCSAKPSNEELYEEATDILKDELYDRGIGKLKVSTKEMTTIKEVDTNLYEVSGSVFDDTESYEYTVTMFFHDDGTLDYEWHVD